MTLWYPSYVDQLIQESKEKNFNCNSNISNIVYNDSALLCNCPSATYHNVTFDLNITSPWQQTDSTIADSTISGEYWWVWFYNVTLEGVAFENVVITNGSFVDSTWSDMSFTNATFNNTTFCNITVVNISSFSGTRFIDPTVNGRSLNGLFSSNIISDYFAQKCNLHKMDISLPSSCYVADDDVDYFTEYLHDLIISAAALPGNITSAILMYFFIRSFWLCKY